MWEKIEKSDYFLYFTHQDNSYEIYVTDYIAVWSILHTKKSFIAQLKNNNELLELENDNDFVQKGIYLLSNLQKLKKIDIKKEDNGNSLFISMKITFGYPFNFECKLSKGSEDFYFEKITKPLLRTIGDLRSSQSELRRLLIKKDKEIEEYKCEGGEIVLRHLKTVAFNDEEHMNKFTGYEKQFGSSELPASLLEKSVTRPSVNVTPETSTILPGIKQEHGSTQPEPNIIKQEVDHVKHELNIPTEVPTSSMSCKQEIKAERSTNYSNSRKRMKRLNY